MRERFDDEPPEAVEAVGPRRAGVDRRRNAARDAVLIEVEAPVRNAGKPMGVQIDQPGRDNLTGHRNGPLGFGRIDVPGDRRNPAAGERHVGRRVEGLRWVDDPSSLEKELVLSSLGLTKCARAGHQDRHRDDAYHLSSVHALTSFDSSFPAEDYQTSGGLD